MYRILNVRGVDLVSLLGSAVPVRYSVTEYYIDRILIEVAYNKRQVNQKIFGSWLIFVKRRLRFHIYFG